MTKTNPTTDGRNEGLAYLRGRSSAGDKGSRLEAFQAGFKCALTASELLVTKLQNQLDGRGNSAVAESAPALHGAGTETEGH